MNKETQRKRTAIEFNNLMNALIDNNITAKQYDDIVNKLATRVRNDPSDFIAPNSFEFINRIRNIHEGGVNTIELFYPIVMGVLLFYVESIKEIDSYNKTKTQITSIVVNFSELTGIDIELVGDMCVYDLYFKKFLAYENKERIPTEKPARVNKEYSVEVVPDLFNW